MIENRLYFFKEADTAVESDVLEISKANLLILEVSGSGTFGIDVMVNVDIANDTFNTFKGIKMNDLSLVESINSAGVYQYDISGASKVKLNLKNISGGNVTVLGVTRGDM